MTTVVNKYHGDTGISIMRGTKWGNPFSHQPNTKARFHVDTREQAVWEYARWLLDQPELLAALDELRGQTLMCCCKPKSCHGDVLAYVIEHGTEALREKVRFHYGSEPGPS